MMILLLTISIFLLVNFIVFSIALILSNKTLNFREKSSPFECGFDINCSNRIPFSLRFFLITIIFLIFDVEIIILLPFVSSLTYNLLFYWWITTFIFITILLIGLFHEWKQGALNWSY